MCDAPAFEEQEAITNIPLPFDDDDLLHVSDEDDYYQYQHDVGIEAEPHEILDLYPTSISNQRPKPRWAQNLIAAAGDGDGNLEDKGRTRSQYQNEHMALSLTDSLHTEWCNKVPRKFYVMIVNDQPLGPQKKKIVYSPPLPSRRNTQIHQFRRALRGSHAQLQNVVAQKNHTAA